MAQALRAEECDGVLDLVEIIPEVVHLGSEPVKAVFHVSVSGPTSVSARLVTPDGSVVNLRPGGERGDPDWYPSYVFRPEEQVGRWVLQVDAETDTAELDFEVRWDPERPRFRTRIIGFEAAPLEIDEGQSPQVRGQAQFFTDGRWVPFAGQVVLIAFRPDDDTEWIHLGRTVTDRDGTFTTDFSPDTSGTVRPELSLGYQEVRELHVTVHHHSDAVCGKPKIKTLHTPLRYRHRVYVKVDGLPATTGKVEIFASSLGKAGEGICPNLDGWYVIYTQHHSGHRWRAHLVNTPSDWSGWTDVIP
ncbi:unnamed protein product [[Actinomadura] parvosata subsp. kistnae]|uniref:Uncharacterized protein n=1 Tax=[Actinomadura] parvosata subsp. kistnae TaxID=1909395 RepID=A0A1U9ZZN9_9ACTN|nr:hypothetical protein [Nonomuraea sp. ATCC 55076]AQZ63415.1 hypothetical protein BKM31_19840 [Nonomuraea sp. ATCC 55076]SPL99138.1 unnamed protein product [Actinomadura parvosata subsp. kistnae]